MTEIDSPWVCQRIAALAEGVAATPLPGEVIEETRLCLLDFLAAALAAQPTPLVAAAVANFGTGRARLLHDRQPASVAGATYVHGFMSTVEDIDDAHAYASGMHLSAAVFPVALALAQENAVTSSRFMRATVAGYEIAGRLARSMDRGLRARGFHATGAIGPFAACATAGVLLALTEAELANAFGIAASGAGGLFAFLPTGAGSRHVHAASAGLVGLMAAVAAKNGVTGPLNAFEGPDGFIGPYSETCDETFIDAAAPAASGVYEIANAYHKRFSACGHAIPAITLALDLRDRLGGQFDQIEAVTIQGYPASAALTNFPVGSISEAKFSLPVIFALATICGDVAQQEMTLENIQRPDVHALAAKVTVRGNEEFSREFPAKRSGGVEIRLRDGGVISRVTRAGLGMPGNRLSFRDITRKFMSFAPQHLGTDRAEELVNMVRDLHDDEAVFACI